MRARLLPRALLAALAAGPLQAGPAPGVQASAATSATDPAPSAGRALAVTFDDLPGAPPSLVSNDPDALAETTRRLLAAVTARRIPAVGFVNEGKLFLAGEAPEQAGRRITVLKQWLDAGLELGNHTFSHRSLNRSPLAEFEEDVVRGETVTRWLLAAQGRPLRFFRHPFLQVGLDLDKRRAFEDFLAQRGYLVAPVTIDNDEWIYAAVYADALRRGDAVLAGRVREDYLRYMLSVVAFDEDVATRLLGRDMAHVLLLHANQLNSDAFGALADLISARGYRFVSLPEALADPAFQGPDTYVGAWGLSWLHHWEITAGRERSTAPDPPTWLLEAQKALSR